MTNMSSSTGLEMLPLLVGQTENPDDMLADVIEPEGQTIIKDAEVNEIKTGKMRAS